MKTVAIIGGSGFIGINLTNYFVSKGYRILVVSRNIEASKFDSPWIETVELDVNFTSKVIDHLKGFENIIWLVNNLVPSTQMDSLIDDFTFNINPLIRFIENFNQLNDLKRFVFLSSGGTIYGDSPNNIPFIETDKTFPISAYGMSKIISENYIEFLSKKSKVQNYILRPSNVYGAHQSLKKPQGIIGHAFNAILNDYSLDLYNEGKIIRDFIYVDDLANAIWHCLESNYENSIVKTYNIGSQVGYSIKEVLALINKVTGYQIKTNIKAARIFDCDYNVLNTKKINTEFGWTTKTNLEDGLQKVWKWIKQ